MGEESNNKRLLLAAALCMVVLIVWQVFFPQKPIKRGKAHPDAAVVAETATAAVDAEATAQATPTPSGEETDGKERVEPEPATIVFEGAVGGEEETFPFKLELTNVGGGIERFTLPSFSERSDKNRPTEEPIGLANPMSGATGSDLAFGQMAGIRFLEGTSFTAPERMVFETVAQSADRVVYRYVTDEGVEIEREYHLTKDSFQVELAVTVRNRTRQPQKHILEIGTALKLNPAMEKGGGFLSSFVPPPDHLNALCHADGEVERHTQQELRKDAETVRLGDSVRWVAMDRQYFVAALVPRDRTNASCALSAKESVGRAALRMPEQTLSPGEEKRHKFTAYLGVKKPAYLTLVDANLEDAIDYKILGLNLAPLCAFLLAILGFIEGLTKSWGVAILGLTILVKLVLFPLNQRSGKSMRAMSALKPEMEKLKEKYGEDRQRQNEEMMKLWRQHNVNPAGGCLPILIQMPIWFALYRSLWVSVDLYQEGFLWIPDLTASDPTWVLPILLVVAMFLQQRMTPTTMDPTQQKIMQWVMPLMFGGMMAALPAGLCFYILVNTLLTILQQHLINKSIGPIGGSESVQGAPA